MRPMLMLRDALGRFYAKHDTPVRLFLKFAAALLTFAAIRFTLGQTAALNHPVVLLALALVCTFLPSNAVIIAGAALIMAHFYGISLEAAVIGGGMLLMVLLLYFSIAPQSAWPLVLTALFLGAGYGCLPALLFGLIGGPLSAMGVGFGAVVYYLVRIVERCGGNLSSASTEAAEAMLQRSAALIQAVISDREMPVMVIALVAAFLAVYFIRTFEMKYAWFAAAVAGCVMYVIIRVCGIWMLDLDASVLPLAAETAVSLAAAWIAQTMLFSLDYKKTETVRFEDDEFYYYVKAVPKKKVRRRKRRRRAEGR